MPQTFESLTALSIDNLDDLALSMAANEYAGEADEPTLQARRFAVATRLRRMEESELHDGFIIPALVELRQRIDVQDGHHGDMSALYRLRVEIDRMVAA
jgi:hypothetical protein